MEAYLIKHQQNGPVYQNMYGEKLSVSVRIINHHHRLLLILNNIHKEKHWSLSKPRTLTELSVHDQPPLTGCKMIIFVEV